MPRRLHIAWVAFLALLLALTGPVGPPPSYGKTNLWVSGDFIYRYSDELLRRYPSRYGGIIEDSPYKTAHDEFGKEVVRRLETVLAPMKSSGAYVETRPFIDESQTGFFNIIGVVPGADPVLRNEFVLVGAHWDCVPWTYDGAIDCGMQVALTTGVAKAFVDYWTANGIRPRRSMMITFFDAEEQGLLGSAGFTTVDAYQGMKHLELPPQASAVAYHDTDMIGANYPGRWLGRSDLDFMPLNINSAPTYMEGHTPQAAVERAFAAYAATSPAFTPKFILYRQDMKAARDRMFEDMRSKFGHSQFTYRDGQTRPLFTDSQKKYINIQDDPADRSDHTVLILQGIPSDLSIGIWDPNAAVPGLLSYHNAAETLEFLNYMYSGQQRRSEEAVLGMETAGMFVAYMMGANHPEAGNFQLGEMNAP
ncbi:MAG TPA: M28 family peptidase [Actinomycetota bacterium]|nr:M28 family peptidase [Actinomycetota bacterium]